MDEFSGAAINWARVRPPVAISACLLGESVRYDGGHKRGGQWLAWLGQFVTWVSVCPEVELGLGVPREPIEIELVSGEQRLLGVESRRDLTQAMDAFAQRRARALMDAGVCGLITKSKSPSCALGSASLILNAAESGELTSGFFVREVQRALPDLPIVEEFALGSQGARERFLADVRNQYRNLVGVSGA